MRAFCLFIFVALRATLCFSQEYPLKFHVKDESTNIPIQFCYVVIKGTNVSSQSDETGFIQIKAHALDTLVIYQLGYLLRKVTLQDLIKSGYVIYLKPKDMSLDEVIISASKTETFQAENNTIFLAFEFYDDFILALVNKGKKYNDLLLLDLDGKYISEKSISVKAEQLFKDCFGNIHLLGTDSIYQVYYNYKNLSLLSPFHITNYYTALKPCECYNGHKYIFKIKRYRALKNLYYMFDDQTQQKNKLLTEVADSVAIKGFNMDFDINYFLAKRRKGEGYAFTVEDLNTKIDQFREELVLPTDYNNLLNPVESEMKKIDSVFVLLDYTHKHITMFSVTGNQISHLNLNNEIDISPKMYYDDDSRQIIFSAKNKNGILTLFKFDLTKNKYTHSFELKEFHFITDFKIKGGNIYFIHKDRSSSFVKTKIIKEVITWKSL